MIIGTPLHNATINRRIAAFGLDPRKVREIARGAAQELRRAHCPADGLVFLDRVKVKVWVGEANGNCLWAVVRNYRLATILLRRDSQPALEGLPVYDASSAVSARGK